MRHAQNSFSHVNTLWMEQIAEFLGVDRVDTTVSSSFWLLLQLTFCDCGLASSVLCFGWSGIKPLDHRALSKAQATTLKTLVLGVRCTSPVVTTDVFCVASHSLPLHFNPFAHSPELPENFASTLHASHMRHGHVCSRPSFCQLSGSDDSRHNHKASLEQRICPSLGVRHSCTT